MAKILVADERTDVARALVRAFEHLGHEVIHAEDGDEALRTFRRARPDAAVVAMTLPKLDGLQVCRLIRKAGDVPTLLLTTEASTDRRVARRIGADDLIAMDAPAAELVSRVRALLERRASAADAGTRAARPSRLEGKDGIRTAREAVAADREHAKGDGNLPKPAPERVRRRTSDGVPGDLPKERDGRDAPQGDVTAGQRERDPGEAMRDGHEAPPRGAPSGFDLARRASEADDRRR